MDPQNAVVPAADVTATHLDTGQSRTTQTNAEGQYLFQLLPVGPYRIVVEHPSFAKVERTGVTLRVNDNIKLDVQLPMSSVATKVEVAGNAPLVQTHDSLMQEVVDSQRVVDLPLNGRALPDLAALSPGVVPSVGGDGTNKGTNQGDGGKLAFNTRSFTVNGSRQNEIHYTLDSGDHTDVMYNVGMPMPFPDAVQEFSVQTAGQSVDVGRSVGGSINIVTKSGTNQVHGDLFWFIRNTVLNANNFFSKTPDNLKRNQGGFTLGGPAIRNKLFLFGGYERTWIRQISGSTSSTTMPENHRQGNFSDVKTAILDPTNNLPFAGNQIPASRMSPAMQNLLAWIPLPGAGGTVTYPSTNNSDINQEVFRADYQANAKNIFYGSLYRQNANSAIPLTNHNMLTAKNAWLTTSESATLAWTFIPTARLASDAHFSANYSPADRTLDTAWGNMASFGVKINPLSGEANVTMSGASSVTIGNGSRPGEFSRANLDLADNWRYTMGRHSFIFGGEVMWLRYNEYNPFQGSGVFAFNGSCSGYSQADAILGCMYTFLQGSGEFEFRRQHYQSLFAGDSIRVTQRLTLNFGLRWEPFTFVTDLGKRSVQFRPELYAQGYVSSQFKNSPPGLAYPGDVVNGSTIPLGGTSNSLKLFAPRFGFAWDVNGDGRTSVRGGWGLYYSSPEVYLLNTLSDQPPFGYTQPLNGGYFDDPYQGRENLNVFPLPKSFYGPNIPFPSQILAYAIEPKYNVAYTQTRNLAVERQLGASWLLRVGYVGSLSIHLPVSYDANAPIYNPSLTLTQNVNTANTTRRPMSQFTNLYLLMTGLSSNYNALQVSFNKRLSHGLTLLTSYAWSKSLDFASNSASIATMDSELPNPFNPREFYGPSEWNVPHRFVESFVYQFPDAGKSFGSSLVSAITRHWALTGIVTLQSGLPFSVTTSSTVTAGAGTAMGLQIGPLGLSGQSRGQQVARYFNTSNVIAALPGTWGDMGRDIMQGPHFANVDTAIYRVIQLPLRESMKLSLRFEAFNALNRPNLSTPNAAVGSITFGQITATAGDPRILQFAMKLAF